MNLPKYQLRKIPRLHLTTLWKILSAQRNRVYKQGWATLSGKKVIAVCPASKCFSQKKTTRWHGTGSALGLLSVSCLLYSHFSLTLWIETDSSILNARLLFYQPVMCLFWELSLLFFLHNARQLHKICWCEDRTLKLWTCHTFCITRRLHSIFHCSVSFFDGQPPLFQTITVLFFQGIEGDDISGTCFTGILNAFIDLYLK